MLVYLWEHFFLAVLMFLNIYRYIVIFWLLATLFQSFVNWQPRGVWKKIVDFLTILVGPPLRFLDNFIPQVYGLDVTPVALLFIVFLLKWFFSWLLGYSL